jgi:hypothetical protein
MEQELPEEFTNLPRIKFSESTHRSLLSKDPDDITDEEYKFVLLRWGYLSDEENKKWGPYLTEAAAIKRLGEEGYFGLMEDLKLLRTKGNKPSFLLTPREVEESRKTGGTDGAIILEPDSFMTKPQIQAAKRRYQLKRARGKTEQQMKAKRKAQRKARKKSRSN